MRLINNLDRRFSHAEPGKSCKSLHTNSASHFRVIVLYSYSVVASSVQLLAGPYNHQVKCIDFENGGLVASDSNVQLISTTRAAGLLFKLHMS